MDIMERARRWEARQQDTYVNVFYGFPWSDVPDIGTTVQVITNNNQPLADSIAEDMADYIWRVRQDFALGTFPMPDVAVDRAKQAIINDQVPVVLADYSDRPGDSGLIRLIQIFTRYLSLNHVSTFGEDLMKPDMPKQFLLSMHPDHGLGPYD
jgi:microcystin degradation protein MlrC